MRAITSFSDLRLVPDARASLRLLLNIALLLACFPACAAPRPVKQQPSLEERLLQPDPNKMSPFANKEFGKAASFGVKTFDQTGAYAGANKKARMKVFETKNFLEINLHRFASKKAPTETFALSEKHFKTHAARKVGHSFATRNYIDASKTAAGYSRSFTVREAPTLAVSQTKIDLINKANADRPMSVEEIRELLNKPGPLINREEDQH